MLIETKRRGSPTISSEGEGKAARKKISCPVNKRKIRYYQKEDPNETSTKFWKRKEKNITVMPLVQGRKRKEICQYICGKKGSLPRIRI
jgi:hypothetical protein